ncbi:hypothetical protein NKR19_g388 [Coniochaeta hoffmannii]|uniref:Uncharacterized protein n=1 Tax=Coniochaeta hoffmannii TaxID=91930 RepID=A0AA38S2N3_9PEZI|nr:hypothetical protein NKR19_g388 [Coniochaeta hoffmannii]
MPARQRPNSMLEWVAGRNITPRRPRSSQARGVLRLQVFTDDAAQTDTVAVTYPRSGNHSTAAPRSSGSKQVTFTEESQQALVKREPEPVEQPPLDSDLEVETSGSEESVEVIKIVKRKKRAKRVSPPATPPATQEPVPPPPVTPPQAPVCLKELPVFPEATDDDGDIDPHPSCRCAKCVYGRKLLRRARGKRKAKEGTEGDGNTNATGETAPIVTDEAQEKAHGENAKQRLPKPYAPPEIRNPNLIVPPRAEVLQIEHAVESPEDPRPNAFVDNEHGICRVYHGPAYGNPYGSLYPRRGLSGPPPFQPLPAGVPHPMHNPYYNGFDPDQMARHGQPPPPGWPHATSYVPPPPPIMGYPPGHLPEGAYPAHMPWPNYQVPAERHVGEKEHNGHKKVPSPVVPPVVPPASPRVVPVFIPPAMPPVPPPVAIPVAEPRNAAQADATEPQKSSDRPSSRKTPPFGLLTPRTIAAKFSDKPVSNPSSKGRDKDKGWSNNNTWGNSPRASNKDINGRNGGGNNGWGGSPRRNSNHGGGDNGWGGSNNHHSNGGSHHSHHNSPPRNHHHGSRHNTPPRNDGWGGGGGGNNDGANDAWGGGSQRSGSKKSSSHQSRNSANQPAADIGGDGWGGGGWDTASVQKNGGGWGGSGPNRGPHHSSRKGSNNNSNNNTWGNDNGNRHGRRGSGGSNHRHHSNSPPSGDRHASGGSGNRRSPPRNDDGRGRDNDHRHGSGGNHHQRHGNPSRMPGSWESLPSNNAGPQGTPGGPSGRHSSPRQHGSGSKGSRGRSQAGWAGGGNVIPMGSPPRGDTWGTFGGSGGGGGGVPSWGDPTAAQSTKAAPPDW